MNAGRRFQPQPAAGTEVELFSVAGTDGYLREVNVSFARLLGVSTGELSSRSVLEFTHPQDLAEVVKALAALEAGMPEVLVENRFRRADGAWIHLQWVARPLPGTDLWWAAGRDTTSFHRLVAQGADMQVRLDLATGQTKTAAWELDLPRDALQWMVPAAVLLGTDQRALPDSLAALIRLVEERGTGVVTTAADELSRLGSLDWEFSLGNTTDARHLALRGRVVERDRRGRAVRAVGLLFDRTREKAMEDQLLKMVMTDPLTGVPNRRAFDQDLKREWRRCRRLSQPLSIAIIDIDHFKRFNDSFGHLVGDEVLTLVSRALAAELERSGGVLTRFGGEEYAVVLPNIGASGALLVADQLMEAVRHIEVRQAAGWRLTVSVGLASAEPGDQSISSAQLLSRADQALYAAKGDGRDRAVSYETALSERAAMEDAIRAGIRAGQFEMYYQPVISLDTEQLTAFEALMRWRSPDRGLVPPDEFIPVAERSELICDLGRFALTAATTQLQLWLQAGLNPLGPAVQGRPGLAEAAGQRVRVAVNLSGRHVADPLVVADVAAALAGSGLPPELLEVELTETALVDGTLAAEHLGQIRRLGVSVSLDDFGTGYTSVGQLPQLPVDVLKIDRSFIGSSEPRQRELVALMISAAHAFGMRVIAEGVEREEDLASLKGLGCDQAQGYTICKPMPAAEVPGWMAKGLRG